MSDAGSDAQAAYALCIEAMQELNKINPDHELLKWLESEEPDDEDLDNALNPRFYDHFWNKKGSWRDVPGTLANAVVYTNYYLALSQAIAEERVEIGR